MYFLRSQQVSYVNNSLHTPYSPCNYNVLDCKDQKRPIDDEIIKYTIASEDSHLPIKLSMLRVCWHCRVYVNMWSTITER